MVWKVKRFLYDIRFLLLLLISIIALSKKVFAYSIYEQGNISNTYVTYFSDILNSNLDIENYVIYRSGQYDYTMACGSFELSNSRIISTGQTDLYIITTNSSNYNNTYNYTVNSVNDFSLSLGNNLVYSNLGYYPDCTEKGDYYEETILLVLCVMFLFTVICKIFRV